MQKIKQFLSELKWKSIIATVVGAALSAIAVVWLLDLNHFFATGSTGVAQILSRLIDRVGNLPWLEGSIFFALNVPLIFIGYKSVSRKFAFYSALSVMLQSIFLIIFRLFDFNPFLIFKEEKLMVAMLAGLIAGVGAGFCLRCGSSTGGVDIISQYVYVKKQGNFSIATFAIDAVIIVGGFFVEGMDFECICYTLVRLIIYLIVVDKMHTVYKNVMIKVVTDKGEEVRDALIKKFNHGITMYRAVGGYSHENKDVLEIAMSSYEINEYRHIIRKVDRDAFITSYQITKIDGFFNHNVM